MVVLSRTIVNVAPPRWPPGPGDRRARRPVRRPGPRRRRAVRRPPRLRRVRRGAALARAARPLQGDGAPVPGRSTRRRWPASAARSSPPGSRHKRGGWRLLSTPVDIALAAVEHPNGPEVWDGLLAEFAAELQQVETGSAADTSARPSSTTPASRGCPASAAARTSALSLTVRPAPGRWDRSRYADRSAARMAVLGAAAARGWRLADVRAAVASGAWKGFPGCTTGPPSPGRMDRLLPLRVAKIGRLRRRGRKTYVTGSLATSTTPPVQIRRR